MWPVGDVRGDFDAAVDGPGGHDEDVVFGTGHPLAVHGVKQGVFADGGERAGVLPLELDAEEVEDVAAGEDVVQVVGDLDAEFFPAAGDERGGATEDDFGPQLRQPPDVGAGGPAVGDVADESDGEAGQAGAAFPDGHDVEQSLRGMLVRAIAGTDDRTIEIFG